MSNELPNSCGTDDDLQLSYHNSCTSGSNISGNKRFVVGDISNLRVKNDMEAQICGLEQEAYCSVLRAFKARSDAITWEKESLMTELRKELRITDEEHRELISRVNSDGIIWGIGKWRQGGGLQCGLVNIHGPEPSPSGSASAKKQKTSQSKASLSCEPLPPLLHRPQVPAVLQPSSAAANSGALARTKGKMPKSMPLRGRGQVTNRTDSGALAVLEPARNTTQNPLIGRRVQTRWPEDGNFYDAIISNYDECTGLHALVYGLTAEYVTYEWVNLNKISPEDIKWSDKDPSIIQRAGLSGLDTGSKKDKGHHKSVSGAGRGKSSQKKKSKSSRNSQGRKQSDDIEILHTASLIKEVEKIFSASPPNPLEMEKARKILKDHEKSLKIAISRLANESDGESGKYI